jgi:hypothetical protein
VSTKIWVQLCFGVAGSMAMIDAILGRKILRWVGSEKGLAAEARWPVRAFEATIGFGLLVGAILS